MRRRVGAAAVVGVAAMAAAGAVAWACTAISAVYSINPSAAPAGTEVVVTGRDFWPRAIEIRWDSEGGPVIGTARGPDFDAVARIPEDAAPGHHRVFAIQVGSRNPHISFEVLAAASPATEDAHGQGDTTLAAGAGPAEPDESPWVNQAATEASGPASSASSPAPAHSGSSSGRPGPGGGQLGGPPSPPPPGTAGPPAHSPEGAPRPGPLASPAVPDTAVAAQPGVASRRVVSGEISFASPWRAGGLRGTNLSQPAPNAPAGSALGVGVALLALGLAGLGGASAFGLRRRERAWITPPHHGQDSL